MFEGLSTRCANLNGLGISQCSPLSGKPAPRIDRYAAWDTNQVYVPASQANVFRYFDNNRRIIPPEISSVYIGMRGDTYKSRGLLYCEMQNNESGSSASQMGLSRFGEYDPLVGNATGYGWRLRGGPFKFHNAVPVAYGGATSTERVSIVWNANTGELRFWRAGVDQGIAFTDVLGCFTFAFGAWAGEGDVSVYVGGPQSPFLYTPPKGYEGGWRR